MAWRRKGWFTIAVMCSPGLMACADVPVNEPLYAPPECVAGTGEIPVEGCNAGIPAEQCGAGFDADGTMGCVALLPANACADGLMAVPGETDCREPASCGSGKWGDIPTGPTTQYVDAGYPGMDSDGTEAKPWTTIGAAVAVAAPGGVVAVAAGNYAEDVLIEQKSVALWGVCPSAVTVTGSDMWLAAIRVRDGADASEIHNLAVTGASAGIYVSGSTDVTIDGVWVHDTAGRGIALQPDFGPPAVSVSSTLVERVYESGIHVVNGNATLNGVHVRETIEPTNYAQGYGLAVQPDPDTAAMSTVEVTGSVFEDNRTAAMLLIAANAGVSETVVRNTLASNLGLRDGVGIIAQDDAGSRTTLDVATSVIADNRARGIVVVGSDLTMNATHIRDTLPQEAEGSQGEGLAVVNAMGDSSTATVSQCTIDRSYDSGVHVLGSSVSLTSVLVRDTKPRARDEDFGRGIAIVGEEVEGLMADANVDACMVENSYAFGIYVADATATVRSTMVRGTLSQISDGAFGDGFAVATKDVALGSSTLSIEGSRAELNVHTGITVMGSPLTLSSSSMECNEGFDLLGIENYGAVSNAFTVDASDDNACGCDTDRRDCSVFSK